MKKALLGMLLATTLCGTTVAYAAIQSADQTFGAVEDCDNTQKAMLEQTAAEIGKYVPPNPNTFFGSGSCLDNLLNTKISLMFGMPSLSNILGGLLDSAMNAACNVANTAVNQALSNVTGDLGVPIPLPDGSIINPGVQVGTVYSAGGPGVTATAGGTTATYSTQTGQVTTTTKAKPVNKPKTGVIDTIKSWFR